MNAMRDAPRTLRAPSLRPFSVAKAGNLNPQQSPTHLVSRSAVERRQMSKRKPLCSSIAAISSLMLSAASFATAQTSDPQPLRSSLQMIVVTTPDWNTVEGRLQRYERAKPEASWKPVGDPIAIVVGKKGMGWGAGLMSTGRPSRRSPQDPVKKE